VPGGTFLHDYFRGKSGEIELHLSATATRNGGQNAWVKFNAQGWVVLNAHQQWRYFQDVITWAELTFTKKRQFMKGVDWGALYNKYKDGKYDTKRIEIEIAKLISDDDVTKKSGIYPYILTRNEKYLSIRAFSDSAKQKVYEKQKGKCVVCGVDFELSGMEADHITPWHEGGKTTEENCQMLCKDDNRRKSGK
jgi:hypothetical protein